MTGSEAFQGVMFWLVVGVASALLFGIEFAFPSALFAGICWGRYLESPDGPIVFEHSRLDNGAEVITALWKTREGVQYVTTGVDRAGALVANRVVTTERDALRNHKELEARVA